MLTVYIFLYFLRLMPDYWYCDFFYFFFTEQLLVVATKKVFRYIYF